MAHYRIRMLHTGNIEFDANAAGLPNWTVPSSGAIAAAKANVDLTDPKRKPIPVFVQTPYCDLDISQIDDIVIT